MSCFGRLFVALALLMAGGEAHAQTKVAKQIEVRLKRTLRTPDGSSTMGMVEAYDKATRSYAVEVGRIFHKLEKELPANQREVLIQGQLAWQEYLKAQRLFVSYVYDVQGTLHKPLSMKLLKDLLQHRLDELCGYFMRLEGEFDEEVPTGEDWCPEKHENLGLEDPLAPASQAVSPPSLNQKTP